jgi:hypothetical protein
LTRPTNLRWTPRGAKAWRSRCLFKCMKLHAALLLAARASFSVLGWPPSWFLCAQVDVTFPRMPCAWLSLDIMEVSGEMHLDVVNAQFCRPLQQLPGRCGECMTMCPLIEQAHDIYQQRLSPSGKPVRGPERHDLEATKLATPPDPGGCGSCYGANSTRWKCCNTCDDVSRQQLTLTAEQNVSLILQLAQVSHPRIHWLPLWVLCTG